MSDLVARSVVTSFRKNPEHDALLAKLSPRQREVLELLAQGLQYKEIAKKLGICYDTAKEYGKAVYSNLEVHSAREAVLYYQRSITR